MTFHAPIPVGEALVAYWHPSWPNRILDTKGTPEEPAALCSVYDEAQEERDEAWQYAAECALWGDWSEVNQMLGRA